MSPILKSIQGKRGLRRYIGPKRIVLLLCLLAFIFFVWGYYRDGSLSPASVENYRNNHPILSVVLLILIYAVSVIASLPSLPLNLAAGFFWGGVLGGLYSACGVTIGGWLSFAATRWLIGQPLAKRFDSKLATKVQREFNRNGWKFVAFARVNPIIPTGPLNYLLGLTSISGKTFLWATFLFLLPPSIAVAYIGDALQTFATQQSDVSEFVRGILIVSAAMTFLASIKFIFRLIKQRVDEQ